MDYKLESCIEEHAMFIYANCSMDEYIEKYEPVVTYGRPNLSVHLRLNINTQNLLNKYIDTKIQKDIYLEHR